MENFNTYTVKLIFLILPGLIGIAVFRALRGRRNRHNWELVHGRSKPVLPHFAWRLAQGQAFESGGMVGWCVFLMYG